VSTIKREDIYEEMHAQLIVLRAILWQEWAKLNDPEASMYLGLRGLRDGSTRLEVRIDSQGKTYFLDFDDEKIDLCKFNARTLLRSAAHRVEGYLEARPAGSASETGGAQ
jgi:hypothetical protein